MTVTPPQPEGRMLGLIHAAKGLTFANVIIIALLVAIAIPVYIVYRALGDEKLLDRLLSSYEEIPSDSDCTLRQVKERGGPERWSVSTGFAFAGADRWQVSVVLDHAPVEDEIASHCATLLLIVDQMMHANGGSTDAP